jgi:hypothetical protein
MILIDCALGARAEFLNAWSVVQRLLGRPPSAGTSVVASRLGTVGEFLVVLGANLALGALLAVVLRLVTKVVR